MMHRSSLFLLCNIVAFSSNVEAQQQLRGGAASSLSQHPSHRHLVGSLDDEITSQTGDCTIYGSDKKCCMSELPEAVFNTLKSECFAFDDCPNGSLCRVYNAPGREFTVCDDQGYIYLPRICPDESAADDAPMAQTSPPSADETDRNDGGGPPIAVDDECEIPAGDKKCCVAFDDLPAQAVDNIANECFSNDDCSTGVCRLFRQTGNNRLVCDTRRDGLGFIYNQRLCEDDSLAVPATDAPVAPETEAPVATPTDAPTASPVATDRGDEGGEAVDETEPEACTPPGKDRKCCLPSVPEDAEINGNSECFSNADCSSGSCRYYEQWGNKRMLCDKTDGWVFLQRLCE